MVDLNKKPLPDSYAELIKVLGKIAAKRETENHEREEIFKAVEAECKLLQRYKQSWVMSFVTALLIAIFVPAITIKEKSSSIWEISYLWEVIIPLGLTFFMLCVQPGKGLTFSNGNPIRFKGLGWIKFFYYILAWMPWYSCIVLRFGVHPLHALWIAPVSLIVLIIWALTRDKVRAQTDPLGLNSVYAEDYRRVRVCQSSGGLNPDAMPPVIMTAANKDAIMRMTPQDWNLIGHRLREAGYKNMLKKGR